jgi:hypothetical protein
LCLAGGSRDTLGVGRHATHTPHTHHTHTRERGRGGGIVEYKLSCVRVYANARRWFEILPNNQYLYIRSARGTCGLLSEPLL